MLASKIARNKDEIIEVCQTLAAQEGLKVTVSESAKGALIAGLGVFLGGLVAGPIGMAIGGSVTSIAVAMNSKGKFKSVVEVLNEMPYDQQIKLKRAIEKAVRKVQLTDCVEIATLILTSTSVKEVVLAELGIFLKNELQLHLVR